MTNKTTIEIDCSAMFWVVLFVWMYLTGNCGMCGGSRDYVGDCIDRKAEGK